MDERDRFKKDMMTIGVMAVSALLCVWCLLYSMDESEEAKSLVFTILAGACAMVSIGSAKALVSPGKGE
jgi:hypothetical protein